MYTTQFFDLNSADACQEWDNFLSWGHCLRNSISRGETVKSAYLKSIINGLGHESYSLICRSKEGAIEGVLPLILTKSVLFGTFLTSLPFFNYGGIYANNEEVKSILLQKAIEIGKSIGAKAIQLRESQPQQHLDKMVELSLNQTKAHMIYELPEAGEAFGEGNSKKRAKLKSQAHLALRRASDLNISIETRHGHLELLNDFYYVFCRHMRDLGTPVYSKNWFRSVLETLGESHSILSITYVDKKPAAVAFLTKDGAYMTVPWASSLKRYNELSLNSHQYWNILTYAQSLGIKLFDFGRSTIDEGTYKFKLQWGAKPVPCYWYNIPLTKENKTDSITPTNPKFSTLIELWKKLPLTISNTLGPHIVKGIP